MTLENRLGRWVEAGLIGEEQATQIRLFEHRNDRPLFLYAVAGLGGLAIAIGIISIVAANWDVIPGRVKIGTNLSLLTGAAVLIASQWRRWPLWARDTALLVLYGLTMGSIALVGQVYQLGGTARVAMATWSLLTLPLMTLGNTAFLAVVWSLGLELTLGAWLSWLGDGPLEQEGWALTGAAIAPWLWLLAGHSSWLIKQRPAYASVFAAIGWTEIVIAGSIGASAFYDDTRHQPWNALWVGFGLGALGALWLWRKLEALPGGSTARWLPIVALLFTFVPARLSPGDWDLLAALLFIALWLLVALSAHSSGLVGVLNLATAVIGIRIVIVYFEVFGSLLDTGLGLVSGGALTLALVWAWWRKKRHFEQQLSHSREHAL